MKTQKSKAEPVFIEMEIDEKHIAKAVTLAFKEVQEQMKDIRCIKPGTKRSDIFKTDFIETMELRVGEVLLKEFKRAANLKGMYASSLKAQMKEYDKGGD
jgi:hypothetical protein